MAVVCGGKSALAVSKIHVERPPRDSGVERVHSKTARTIYVLARKTNISAQFSRVLPRASFATRPTRAFSSRGGKEYNPPPLAAESIRIQSLPNARDATRRAIPRRFDIVRIFFLHAKKYSNARHKPLPLLLLLLKVVSGGRASGA